MTTIGPYTIDRELGRGGMGVVYLARDPASATLVAVKRLLATAAGEAGDDALEREFAAALRLRHPVIVNVQHLGRDRLGPYLVMEYVDGDDLEQLAGKSSPERIAGWACQVADALEYARRRGLLHGDIKPQNLLVPRAEPDRIRLLDLGLVGAVGGPAAGGTPAYLAPEVIAGRDPDARSDLFSLGCVLYQCVAGRPPFADTDRSPPPPLAADVPPLLAQLIGRLLQRRPDDRPGRPADLIPLLGDLAGQLSELPEGDLIGRDAVFAAAAPGTLLVIEAAPGMGATRLLRELVERAELDGRKPPSVWDVGSDLEASRNEPLAAVRPDRATVVVVRPGAAVTFAGATVLRLDALDGAGIEGLVASRLPLEPGAIGPVARWVLAESGGEPALAVAALDQLRHGQSQPGQSQPGQCQPGQPLAACGRPVLVPGPLGLQCDLDALAAAGLPPEAPLVRARLATLDPAGRRAAGQLAILGAGTVPPQLAPWLQIGDAQIGADGRVRFRAQALARAATAALDPTEVAELHGAAADTMASASNPDPAALARHLLAAGRTLQACPWLRRAAHGAGARSAHVEQRQLLELELDARPPGPQRAQTRFELGQCLLRLGKAAAALEMLQAARTEDPALLRATLIDEAELRVGRKEHGPARSAAVEVIRLSRGPDGEESRARALLVLGRVAAGQGRFGHARRHFDGALCLYRKLGLDAGVARAANALATVAYLEKRYDDALTAYQAALVAARAGDDQRMCAAVLQNLANIYAYHRRSAAEAAVAVGEAVEVAERLADPVRLARALVLQGVLALDGGRADDARRSLERAIELRESCDDPAGVVHARRVLAELFASRGEFPAAAAALDAARNFAVDAGDRVLEADVLDEMGRVALERADPVAAVSYLSRAMELAAGVGQEPTLLSVQATLAVAHVELAQTTIAAELVAGWPDVSDMELDLVARVEQARARLELASGRPKEACERLSALADELAGAGFELELARTLLQLGPALSQLGRRDEARERLEQARAVFERHGAKPGLARTLVAKARWKAEGRW